MAAPSRIDCANTATPVAVEGGRRSEEGRSKSLRINWINPRPNLSGGIKSNRLIGEAMVRRGHDVRIVYVDRGRPWPGPWHPLDLARRAWSEAQEFGRPRHHLQNSVATLIPVRRRFIRAEDVPDADVSIGTWWETMEWIRDWPECKGIKAYFIRHHELHGGDPERVRATYRRPCLKLVIAKWLQRLMAEEYGDPNAVLVPNGVDWSQFGSPPREKPPVPTVGMLYGPQDWKGADTAFAALRIVQRTIPELRVVSFARERLSRQHQPPDHFSFTFRPSQRAIPELYRAATCWLVPSTSEGFGMPGLEAAACRCPIVATRSGGPEDYVQEGVSGRLVSVGDPREMAEALLFVLQCDAARWRSMSDASLGIAEGFSWDRSAETLERALHEAVAARGSGDRH